MIRCRRCKEEKPPKDCVKNVSFCKECARWADILRNMAKGIKPQTRHLFSVLSGYKWCSGCKTIHTNDKFTSLKYKLCQKCQHEAAEKWRANNPEKARETARSFAERKRNTPHGRIEARVLNIIRETVKYRAGYREIPTDWAKALGYTFPELKVHIESRFTDGMSWKKLYDGEVEIDHVIPRSSFYYETIEDQDFKDCWMLKNLQPLWKSDNREKSDKMPDGSDGSLVGLRKRALLAEESSVAGWELNRKESSEEDFSA